MIYEELKAYSAEARASPYSIPNKLLRATLLDRHDPLIDFCLAQYGAIPETLNAIDEKAASVRPEDPIA